MAEEQALKNHSRIKSCFMFLTLNTIRRSTLGLFRPEHFRTSRVLGPEPSFFLWLSWCRNFFFLLFRLQTRVLGGREIHGRVHVAVGQRGSDEEDVRLGPDPNVRLSGPQRRRVPGAQALLARLRRRRRGSALRKEGSSHVLTCLLISYI